MLMSFQESSSLGGPVRFKHFRKGYQVESSFEADIRYALSVTLQPGDRYKRLRETYFFKLTESRVVRSLRSDIQAFMLDVCLYIVV